MAGVGFYAKVQIMSMKAGSSDQDMISLVEATSAAKETNGCDSILLM